MSINIKAIIIAIILATSGTAATAGIYHMKENIKAETMERICNAGVIHTEEEIKALPEVYFDMDQVPLDSSSNNASLRQLAIEAADIVNDIRLANGLNALEWNFKLEDCAYIRAIEASEYFSHTRPNGKSWWTVNSDEMGGENLAYGYNDANSVVNAWMNSQTHAYNILYNKFKRASIAVYQLPDGTMFWAEEFGY